jgi:transposase-like protein
VHVVLPGAERRSAHDLNNGLERDHQHVKSHAQPMRQFKRLARANTLCRGHVLIRNLGHGFSGLTDGV